MDDVDQWDMSGCGQCNNGLISSQGCKGAPAFGSSPHFYNAHPDLVQQVEGVEPSHDKHATFLNIEPFSGISFQAHARLQVS